MKSRIFFLILFFGTLTDTYSLAPKGSVSLREFQEKRYQQFKDQVLEKGIDTKTVDEITDRFSYDADGERRMERYVAYATGVALEPPDIAKLQRIQAKIIQFFSRFPADKGNPYKKVFYPYFTDQDESDKGPGIHSTLMSYGHYRNDQNKRDLPLEKFETVRRIVGQYDPIEIEYSGLLIQTDGSIILKGYFFNEDYYRLTEELSFETKGKKERRNSVYLNFGRLTQQLDKQVLLAFYEFFQDDPDLNLGKITYLSAKGFNGEVFYFRDSDHFPPTSA
ncbi:MAG: hypothetical protein JW774_06380 [Candidatus Aureabacteria bacterium]|nr:hypothetical protein [Candidatus Auribacterota bacterium]